MSNIIAEEDRIEAQRLLRDVLLIFSDLTDIEKRLQITKDQSKNLYQKLDNIIDGENQG